MFKPESFKSKSFKPESFKMPDDDEEPQPEVPQLEGYIIRRPRWTAMDACLWSVGAGQTR